jgi:predicted DNA-binding protein (MmcQ/YjbR family)
MDIEQLRDYCLSKPLTEEGFPFGSNVLVFKVKGKIFLLASLDTPQLQFNVKCNPDLAEELREQYSCVIPGFHMNKKHWNTIIPDGTVSTAQIKEWIDHSYDLIFKSVNTKG